MASNFLPNIRCPHCGHFMVACVSGYGRTGYNTRGKQCPKCKAEFVVEVIVAAAKVGNTPDDITMYYTKRAIKAHRRARHTIYEEQQKRLADLQKDLTETLMLLNDGGAHA